MIATAVAPGQASAQQVVVGFDAGASAETRAAAFDGLPATRRGAIAQLRTVTIDIPDHAAERVRRALQQRPGVRYVVEDVRMSSSWTPNDPRLGSQWGIERIRAATAWDTTRGSSTIAIAVVDTGVDYAHEDLAGRVVLGHDFVAGDSDPFDENGHGTHVAGIAAASADNGIGIAGTAPASSILAVRVLDASGSGYMSWIANGIVYAADRGARVINLSLGGSRGTTTLHDAIVYARGKGAVVTCATGNDGASSLSYPAAYDGCLAVGATDSRDARATFSNYGTGIDLVAPGVSILSTTPANGYASWSGTSMATPFASGVAALLAARGLSGVQIEEAITASATDLGSAGYDTVHGHGRLDAAAAVARTVPAEPAPAQPAPVEPAPTEPAPTEPAPAEPAPEPTNSAPVCSGSRITASGPTSIRLACTDADGNPLTLAIASAPTKGSLSAIDQATGTVAYTPYRRAKGWDSFTFRASDGAASSGEAKVAIKIATTSAGTTKTRCYAVRSTRTRVCVRSVTTRRAGRTTVRTRVWRTPLRPSA